MVRILIADDHEVVRNGIIRSLGGSFPDAEFGEAGTTAETLRRLHAETWDLLILDINMPGRNGLEVLHEIREKCLGIPVIILSMFPEDQFAVRVIKAGASSYLTKDVLSKELVTAVRRTLAGEIYLTRSVTRLISEELREETAKPCHKLLSDREYQVFQMIASGKNISGIARELSLSVKTISVYRANILQKMNLKNNSEITHYAFKHNLVDGSTRA